MQQSLLPKALFIEIVFLRELPEGSHVLVPVGFGVGPEMPLQEVRPNLLGAAHFVNHVLAVLTGPVEQVVLRVELIELLKHVELDIGERGLSVVGEVHLYTLQLVPFPRSVERRVIDGPEDHSLQTEAVQVGSEFMGLYP